MKTQTLKLDAILNIGVIRTATEEEIQESGLTVSANHTVYCFEPFTTKDYDKLFKPCLNVSKFITLVYNWNFK